MCFSWNSVFEWHIPEDAERPDRRNKRDHAPKTLLVILQAEQDAKIAADNSRMNVDDIVETANHFRCVDMIIKHAKYQLGEKFI